MSPIKSVSLIILSLSTKFYLYIQFEIYKKLRNQNKLPVRIHLIIRQIYPPGKELCVSNRKYIDIFRVDISV